MTIRIETFNFSSYSEPAIKINLLKMQFKLFSILLLISLALPFFAPSIGESIETKLETLRNIVLNSFLIGKVVALFES